MGIFKKYYQRLVEDVGQNRGSTPNKVIPQQDDKQWDFLRGKTWGHDDLRGLMDPNAMPPQEEPEDSQWDYLKGQTWDNDTLQGLMDPNEPTPRPKLPPLQNKSYINQSQVPGYLSYLQNSRNAQPRKPSTEFDDVDFGKVDVDNDSLRGLLDPSDPNYQAPPAPFKPLNIPTSLDDAPGANVSHPAMSDDKNLATGAKQLYVIRASRMGVPDAEIMNNLVSKYGVTPNGAKSLMNRIRKGWNTHMNTTESFFGNFFANKQQPKNPLFNHPKLGQAFGALVQQFGGDEKKAEQELQRLQQSSFGQYQLGRLGSNLANKSTDSPSGGVNPASHTPDDAKFNNTQATSLGGQQMFGNQPGSYKPQQ